MDDRFSTDDDKSVPNTSSSPLVVCKREDLEAIRDGMGTHCPGCGDLHALTDEQKLAYAVLERLLGAES